MSNTRYLIHHGIEGQKWGVRNGPPYPLDKNKFNKKKKKKSEPVKKTKEQSVAEGSAKDILEYFSEMSNQEISSALNRVQWRAQLERISSQQNPSIFKKIENIMDDVGRVTNWGELGLRILKIINKAKNMGSSD